MTMKMISNTSITSTMGVTLMLEFTFFLRHELRFPLLGLRALEFFAGSPSGIACEIKRLAFELNRRAGELTFPALRSFSLKPRAASLSACGSA